MKKFLVPCDFSKPAIHAFRYALDMALKSKGTVCLLNVIELPGLHIAKLIVTVDRVNTVKLIELT